MKKNIFLLSTVLLISFLISFKGQSQIKRLTLDEAIEKQAKILKFIDTSRKKQVKRIKANEVGTRNSMLFLGLLSEGKNLLLQGINMLKSQRDFTNYIANGIMQEED